MQPEFDAEPDEVQLEFDNAIVVMNDGETHLAFGPIVVGEDYMEFSTAPSPAAPRVRKPIDEIADVIAATT